MLVSKNIKTWLIISNESPSFMKSLIVPYKISLLIFSNKGHFINNISMLVKPNENLKVCLNNYVDKIKDLKTYYVKVTRAPLERGFKALRDHIFIMKLKILWLLCILNTDHEKIISLFKIVLFLD